MTSRTLGKEAHFSHFMPGTDIPLYKHLAQTEIKLKGGGTIRQHAHYYLPFKDIVSYETLITWYKESRGSTALKRERQWFMPAGSGAYHGRLSPTDDDRIIRMQAVFDLLKDRRFNLNQETKDALRASLADDED